MLLLEHTAWAHLNSDRLAEERREEVIAWMREGEIATCLPFLLEAGYSARSSEDYMRMMLNFDRITHVTLTAKVERRAREAQRGLARVGHHRLTPMDLIIAACAESEGAGVLHYDGDYDVIAQRTSLQFASEWLAPPGSL